MRAVFGTVLAVALSVCMGAAHAEPLSGGALKKALSEKTLILSKNGKKTKRRLELTLRANGTAGSLHVPSGQVLPMTWNVSGRTLCLTQKKDGKEFCMATQVEGSSVLVQMQSASGKTNQLKGTLSPLLRGA